MLVLGFWITFAYFLYRGKKQLDELSKLSNEKPTNQEASQPFFQWFINAISNFCSFPQEMLRAIKDLTKELKDINNRLPKVNQMDRESAIQTELLKPQTNQICAYCGKDENANLFEVQELRTRGIIRYFCQSNCGAMFASQVDPTIITKTIIPRGNHNMADHRVIYNRY